MKLQLAYRIPNTTYLLTTLPSYASSSAVSLLTRLMSSDDPFTARSGTSLAALSAYYSSLVSSPSPSICVYRSSPNSPPALVGALLTEALSQVALEEIRRSYGSAFPQYAEWEKLHRSPGKFLHLAAGCVTPSARGSNLLSWMVKGAAAAGKAEGFTHALAMSSNRFSVNSAILAGMHVASMEPEAKGKEQIRKFYARVRIGLAGKEEYKRVPDHAALFFCEISDVLDQVRAKRPEI